MKKVGILTFHCAENYGAMLQAYALQEYIKSQGCEVEIINYRPDYLIAPYKLCPKLSIAKRSFLIRILSFCKAILYTLLVLPQRLKRKRAFITFSNQHLQLSHHEYTKINANYDYDLYIVGSDQVWNPQITGLDGVYFCNFKTRQTAKCITYAASMSNYTITPEQKNVIGTYLKNLTALSFREQNLEEFIHDNYAIKGQTVLDPTLLVAPAIWDNIVRKPRKSRYLLIYTIGMRDESYLIATKIAQQRGLSIVEIITSETVQDVFSPNKYIASSPGEFLGLFKYADFVVTSSFHGTSFSIIFNKQFYVIGRGNDKDSRIRSLLSRLNIESRLIFNEDAISSALIDYTKVSKNLSIERNASMNYLTPLLENE